MMNDCDDKEDQVIIYNDDADDPNLEVRWS